MDFWLRFHALPGEGQDFHFARGEGSLVVGCHCWWVMVVDGVLLERGVDVDVVVGVVRSEVVGREKVKGEEVWLIYISEF